MTKLTEAQKKALSALPVKITMWGGKPFSGMPKGVWSRSTLNALLVRKLALVRYVGTAEVWSITEEGKKVLEAAA